MYNISILRFVEWDLFHVEGSFMQQVKARPQVNKQGGFFSVLLKTVLVLLTLAALGSMVTIRVKIEQAESRVAVLAKEADLRQRTLDQLLDDSSKTPTNEDLLNAAHEAGYVLPGERVFEDAVRK